MYKAPFSLAPEYRDYVWGGSRLRPQIVPTAEAWVIFAGNRITSGPYAGRNLSGLAAEFGSDLLGSKAVAQTGHKNYSSQELTNDFVYFTKLSIDTINGFIKR